MRKSDKILVIVLRYLVGIGGLFALVPVFMPFSWMVATHRWLGLGEMPTAPVVEYLARSISAFYAFFGAFVSSWRRTWNAAGLWYNSWVLPSCFSALCIQASICQRECLGGGRPSRDHWECLLGC